MSGYAKFAMILSAIIAAASFIMMMVSSFNGDFEWSTRFLAWSAFHVGFASLMRQYI